MQQGSRSCVLAVDDGRLQGIFTERDVLDRCMDTGFNWDQPIGDSVLTRPARTMRANGTVAEAIATMQQHHYRTLPVVDGDRVVGLVRVGDPFAGTSRRLSRKTFSTFPRARTR